MLGQAYSLLGFQIVDGVVGAGYPQKHKHSAVFAQISPDGSRLTGLARKANMSPQAMGELVDELVDMGYVIVVRPADGRAGHHRAHEAWPGCRGRRAPDDRGHRGPGDPGPGRARAPRAPTAPDEAARRCGRPRGVTTTRCGNDGLGPREAVRPRRAMASSSRPAPKVSGIGTPCEPMSKTAWSVYTRSNVTSPVNG